MPSLPIPVFAALVLLFLFLRMWIADKRVGALATLLAVCAAQAMIIALAQHYHLRVAQLLQPITATLIPVCAWIAYQTTAVRPLRRVDALNALVPLTALAARVTTPAFLDVLIPGAFLAYGLAILFDAVRGPDAQPRASLESGDLPARIWLVIGAALIASAFSDVLIFAAQATGAGHLTPWIISIYAIGNLLLIGLLSLSEHLQTETDQDDPAPRTKPDGLIWDKVQRYMTDQRPYLDPDLTLTRLSRRLGVPAKALSATVNRATGENVSRYVNNARIEAAQQALLAGENVTNAMLGAGFNTKSNFNREFLRVTGASPSAWLAANRP